MKLKVLVDNNTYIDKYYIGEPAVSYYIETEGKKILFDAGYSDVFMKNAESMGLRLSDLDIIALSHGHNDHSGGLKEFIGYEFGHPPMLIAHPDALLYKEADGLEIGCPVSLNVLKENVSMELSDKPVKLTDKLLFLGEIPVTNDFEPRYCIGNTERDGIKEKDYMFDDTALIYIGKKGLYIITGCSHSGICNIVSYAKKITGEGKIAGIIGGFHLFNIDDRTKRTIEFLLEENIPVLYPCHCTAFNVKAEISRVMKLEEVGVGLELNWE